MKVLQKSDKIRKKIVLKLIAILLPFFLLILAESLLRLFSYGDNRHLFIEAPENKNFLVFNPHASEKYFIDPAFSTTGDYELFKKKKDPNTLRFFVLGESTTIGYPYFHNASFHRWLLYRLMHSFPKKNFEIINLSLTAVNSYTVLGFAKEVVNYDPDGVLIYVGHNEYYGALGVGSTQSIAGSPGIIHLMLQLRQLRIVQLMTEWYLDAKAIFRADHSRSPETRMELMVASRTIPYNSKLFKRGVRQFHSNMKKILDVFQQHHIPVFLSNLVSNEKDLPPFVSQMGRDHAGNSKSITAYDLGVKELENNDSLKAYANFKMANHFYSGNALCNYYLGQLSYHYGDYKMAKNFFIHAKDLDELRFRAPEIFDQIITDLSNRYSDVHLVDVRKVFEKHSCHQIIGSNLVIDHVHPTLKGFSLMSDAFYREMKRDHVLPAKSHAEMSYSQLVREMPISKLDSVCGIFRIWHLKSHWPFNDSGDKRSFPDTTIEERLARDIVLRKLTREVAMDSLSGYYVRNKQWKDADKLIEGLVLEHCENPFYYEKAAIINGKLGNDQKALFYFRKSFDLSPSFEKAKYLFVIYLKDDEPEQALPFLNYAIAHNDSKLGITSIKPLVGKVIELKKELLSDSANTTVLNQIAETYLEMGNKAGAGKYVDLVLGLAPDNSTALMIRKKMGRIVHE